MYFSEPSQTLHGRHGHVREDRAIVACARYPSIHTRIHIAIRKDRAVVAYERVVHHTLAQTLEELLLQFPKIDASFDRFPLAKRSPGAREVGLTWTANLGFPLSHA